MTEPDQVSRANGLGVLLACVGESYMDCLLVTELCVALSLVRCLNFAAKGKWNFRIRSPCVSRH